MYIHSNDGVEIFDNKKLVMQANAAEVCQIHTSISQSQDRKVIINNELVDCFGDVRSTKHDFTVIDTMSNIKVFKGNKLWMDIQGKRADQIEIAKDSIFHLRNNTVTSYSENSKHSVTLHGLNRISLSPDEQYICLFIKKKNGPSFAKLCHVSNLKSFLSSVTLMTVQYIDFYWCQDHCIIQAINESGGGYYGNSWLYMLNCQGFNCRINLSKEGPIHFVNWDQTNKQFCVVYGFMPAQIDVFNVKCDVVYSFAPDHVNYCKYSHNGQFLAICGFGNMPGDCCIYNTQDYKVIGKFRASLTSELYFSNDNQFIITATFYRRLKVDNGFSVWHPSGAKIQHFHKSQLYAIFEHINPDNFVIKLNPPPKNAIVSKTTKAVKYVPPSMRSANTPKVTDPDSKKIKVLRKKIKDIEALKSRSLNDGLKLDQQQLTKISKLDELQSELKKLMDNKELNDQ
eukprot:NODE_543_length_6878_cov_0.317008.p2 type:complete len:455 gc:universal NODE_543_length_6878_cov_0.317008:899-2263(+)